MGILFKHSITLVELLLAVALIGLLIVGISSLDSFARLNLITSDRRVQLQNELTLVLEDMSRSIFRATGNNIDRGIASIPNGFQVRVDNNNTPEDYTDDDWIDYTLSGNRINKDAASLNTRDIIISPGGFNFTILDQGIGIEISLVGRFDPTQNVSIDNPGLEMRTKIYSRSASSAL